MQLKKNRTRWGSHIPILRYINNILRVEKVLEVGSGIYSSRTFLDKKYFPDLISVQSFETNKKWYKYMRKTKDARYSINLIKHVYNFPEFYDLIFVDGSESDRKKIMGTMPKSGTIFVMHDSETYKVSYPQKYSFEYTPPSKKCPSTLVVSDVIDVSVLHGKIKWENDYKNWKL